MSARLSAAAARRLAIAAQGLAAPRPAAFTATTRHLRRVVARVGVVQIDSVNVLARSQYLPFFSRLGPYDPAVLDRMRDRHPRALVECWWHEASLVPPEHWPLAAPRMRRENRWLSRLEAEAPGLRDRVRDALAVSGPLTARELEIELAHEEQRRKDSWGWNWSLVKRAVEHLFWCGEVTSAGRNGAFERRYALAAQVLPPAVVDAGPHGSRPLSDAQAHLGAVRVAARALGVGTESDLADYPRIPRAAARQAVAALQESGELEAVTVEGWSAQGYRWRGAGAVAVPRAVAARALLSPFDSMVWFRERTERLFGMRYRIEIYTPAAKRVHGYYVLPFLLGDALVARVDLKADRKAGVLRVQRLTWEPGAPAGSEEALGEELAAMAAWLGLAPA